MKTIVAVLCLMALVIWGGKSAIEATNRQIDTVTAAAQPPASEAAYGMLPSGDYTNKPENIPEIAPAAGDTPK